MGLLDVLNGMMNGPRGQPQPGSGKGGGGMSPLMMALLALLAYKAVKGRGRATTGSGPAATPNRPTTVPSGGTTTAGKPSGGLGDILGDLLGGKSGGTTGSGTRPGSPQSAPPGGSLTDLLRGGLGGLLGGAAAGNVLSGGLGNLIKELEQQGHGAAAQSWIGSGPNQKIAPGDLANALGSDTLDELAQHTGMSRDELASGLSQFLPELVDHLTPHGRLPTEEEAARMV